MGSCGSVDVLRDLVRAVDRLRNFLAKVLGS